MRKEEKEQMREADRKSKAPERPRQVCPWDVTRQTVDGLIRSKPRLPIHLISKPALCYLGFSVINDQN